MNHRQMSKKCIEKLKLKIKKYTAELDKLKEPNIVRITWMAEIKVIMDQIDKAHSNGGWVFDGDYKF
jgi:hypothetical protein